LFGLRLRPFLGVSVSSRPLPTAQAVEALNWSLRGEHPVLPILIADEIAYLNYMALSHYSSGNAMRRALRDAEFQLAHWQEALWQMRSPTAGKARFLRWPEVATPAYRERVAAARAEFKRGGALRQAVLDLTEGFIQRTGKTVTEPRKLALAEYVLEELPLLLFGLHWEGTQYQALIYPTRHPAEMGGLVQAIRSEPVYAGLRRELRADDLEYNTLIDLVFADCGPADEPRLPPPGAPGADPSRADGAS